jgi:hypothetical protein
MAEMDRMPCTQGLQLFAGKWKTRVLYELIITDGTLGLVSCKIFFKYF